MVQIRFVIRTSLLSISRRDVNDNDREFHFATRVAVDVESVVEPGFIFSIHEPDKVLVVGSDFLNSTEYIGNVLLTRKYDDRGLRIPPGEVSQKLGDGLQIKLLS